MGTGWILVLVMLRAGAGGGCGGVQDGGWRVGARLTFDRVVRWTSNIRANAVNRLSICEQVTPLPSQ